MNKGFKSNIRLLITVFLLTIALVLLMSSCEPGGWLIIDNQYNQDVKIYVTFVRPDGTLDEQVRDYGTVPAKSIKELASITFTNKEHVFRIEAKDSSDKVVFSHDYNYYDLEKISWKITIPP